MSQVKEKLKEKFKKKEVLSCAVTVKMTESERERLKEWEEEMNTSSGSILRDLFRMALEDESEEDGENG